MLDTLFYFLIYPGLLFAGIIGGLLTWVDRKLTAQVHFRKGPPVMQPYYDFLKLLLVKETTVPAKGSQTAFLLAPVLALSGATIAGVLILLPLFNITAGFEGDIIVIFYLLAIPSLMFILGALASGNPLAAVGGSREMKLVIGYELTFLLVIAGIILKSGQAISINEIILLQKTGIANIGSISGVLLFIAGIFCIQAKLGLVPFDMGEAETEIAEGAFIEYSGSAFAMIKLTKYILFLALPAFIVTLFMAGTNWTGIGILWAILKILVVVILLTLIRNTNPRLRIGQAMRFFFVWMNLFAIAAIVLTYFGL